MGARRIEIILGQVEVADGVEVQVEVEVLAARVRFGLGMLLTVEAARGAR